MKEVNNNGYVVLSGYKLAAFNKLLRARRLMTRLEKVENECKQMCDFPENNAEGLLIILNGNGDQIGELTTYRRKEYKVKETVITRIV